MRFDWGVAGLQRVAAGADVIVLVDVLPGQVDVLCGPDHLDGRDRRGDELIGHAAGAADQLEQSRDPLIDALAEVGAPVILANLRNRAAVARWIRERQATVDARFTVSIIARGGGQDGALVDFAVEDLLGVGALVDALAELGIDYHSPEAAVAVAGFTGLRRAIRQLIKASATGRELIGRGLGDEIAHASEIDVSGDVSVLA